MPVVETLTLKTLTPNPQPCEKTASFVVGEGEIRGADVGDAGL